MLTIRTVIWLALVAVLACPRSLTAQWTTIGNGIEYREYSLSDPNRVFVARMSRANPNCAIESTIAQGKLYSGLERVTGQAARYDDVINYAGGVWGQRNDVVVAINGDFWTAANQPTGIQIQSGWYCWQGLYPQWGGWSGMACKLDGGLFMGGCLYHPPANQVVRYLATNQTQTFTGINTSRGSDDLVIYTPQYDSNTHTSGSGVEVLVEMSRPLLIVTAPDMVTGTIREIRQNQSASLIPFDHLVLSASGSKATTLLANATVGAQIGVSQKVNDYVPELNGAPGCANSSGYDWSNTYAAVGGNFTFLRNGDVPTPKSGSGLLYDDPRTAVAFNNDYAFFLVVDGRQSSWSIGMTAADLASFCSSSLGATWGYNQDGGGSSAMVVNGVLKNRPSDNAPNNTERAVANGLVMINVLPKQQSTKFQAGDLVKTVASADLRLGPGTNYASFATLAANAQGTVLNHSMAGVYAKGLNWWKCSFNGVAGWVDETKLAEPDRPGIRIQPADVTVAHGGTASFAVEAYGALPLHYQWQKNGTDLAEGGRRSGVQTATLTIVEATGSDNAAYRCRVSNTYDTVTSNAATLTVRSPDIDRDDDVDQDDFGILQLCLSGSGEPQNETDCQRAKLDTDADVDGTDLELFRRCLAKPGLLPVSTCMQN